MTYRLEKGKSFSFIFFPSLHTKFRSIQWPSSPFSLFVFYLSFYRVHDSLTEKLEEQLKELGSKLESPPSAKDAILKLLKVLLQPDPFLNELTSMFERSTETGSVWVTLKRSATCLSEIDQSPPSSIVESMQPFLNAIVKPELLNHQDREAKLLVATCICEITRIIAPEAPYSDDILKDILSLIVGTFNGLSDTSGLSFGRRVVILETLAKYRSCVVMLDLECDVLVNEIFGGKNGPAVTWLELVCGDY
ncbi:sister chromatid cohesion protein PDS5-like [Hibiscus syriacus]|uniref:sister chromatid cohesion protein PDS5-like n=1 Tax=Hibiscus syriacus TaxID=106335 RepID=UPI0019241921|nr:sister chromatid cohesion protein PDS5-like [Hibiscus syriacus]